MKRLILIAIGIVFVIAGYSQNTYFYYYKNARQSLNLNTKYAYIAGDTLDIENYIYGNSSAIENPDSLSYSNGYTIIEFKGELSETDYLRMLHRINKRYNLYAEQYFINKSFDKIGTSEYFYFRLKDLGDTLTLYAVAQHERLQIISQDEFMPLWFTLKKDISSTYNSVELANRIYETNLFSAVEPDLMTDGALSNDSLYSMQWNLKNTGQYNAFNYECYVSDVDIDIENAWTITEGDTNIKVAVIDGGIYLMHPDLMNNLYYKCYDATTGDSTSYLYTTHGTTCAGIIGAVKDNNIGITGIAPTCRLISVSNDTDTMLFNYRRARGINWAWHNEADVINCSWHSPKMEYIFDAIDSAVTFGRNEKGCIVVCAAGNKDLDTVNFPANMSNTIAVGAISIDGSRMSPESCDGSDWGSHYGDGLDIMAPGEFIPTTTNKNVNYAPPGNSNPTLYTNLFDGTSAAAPHVSGVAALILSIDSNLTWQQVRDIMELSAQKVGGYDYTLDATHTNGTWHEEMGYGLLDAYRSVLMAKYYNCYTSGNRVLEYVQQDTTVNDSLVVRNDITITNGATLTVQGTLQMFPNTRIYVKPGGKLVVNNGKITNYQGCNMNEYWNGIYVEGQTDQPQTEEFQGTVELNNATIENSRLAISTQGYPNNWLQTGGIIKAEYTTFKNNINGIRFLPYHNYSIEDTTLQTDNVSYVKMCTFTWNDSIIPTSDTVFNHIKLYDVSGINITGTTFKDDRSNSDSIFTHGILTESSAFSCDWFLRFNNRADITVDTFYTFFKDLSYGLRADNLETENKTFSISNTRFVDNYCGIFATNIDSLSITRDYFYMKNTPISNYSWGGLGVSLENCTGYTIANNLLQSSNNIREHTVGIQIKNSGSGENYVNNNEIKKLYYGTQSIGNNSGLQYKCNSFTSNDYGIYVLNIQGLPFLAPQGSEDEAVYNLFVNQDYADIWSEFPRCAIYFYPENTTVPLVCSTLLYPAPAPEQCGAIGIGDIVSPPPFGPILDPINPNGDGINAQGGDITVDNSSIFFADKDRLISLAQEDNSLGVKAKQILYFREMDLSFHPKVMMDSTQDSDTTAIANKMKQQGETKELATDEEYTLSPNPANSEVVVKGTKGISEITILDLQGKEFKSIYNTEKFNISFLKNGTYIVRIKDSGNKVHYQKLIKQ